MVADEDLWEMTLEQLHLEYEGAADAGGGDFTQELRDKVLHLLMFGKS